MIYFWSDTHFNHAGILKHASRPYTTVDEMNQALIDRWNSVVLRESDEVYLLGDFAFAGGWTLDQIFYALRGRKHLIVGNHDERNPKVLKLPWESTEKLKTFKWEGFRAELCHYPLSTWKGAHTGTVMIHGHSHGNLPRIPRRYDVGADVYHCPVTWEALRDEAARETYIPVDHHGQRRSK